MSETRDKRRRNDLDLFVLALIDSGIATPYEFQRAAGLSQGATIPALRRLLEKGLVLSGKAGTRGRIVHKLTVAGRKRLNDGWKGLVADGPSGDLDADLRVALLAFWIGKDQSAAVQLLRKSAAGKRNMAGAHDELQEASSLPPLAHLYRNLRAAAAKALIKGESAAALAMAQALTRQASAKRKSSHGMPRLAKTR